eukprot:TRINITY_DN2404_c0_g1_i2.p1 TRINITY_DN2404_c0_g1~~TRINITY_DN2404_c0_g1_i2.p1  ORF type:complete len:301 (-),score=52.76 TRINITY_DN2404_c0_g1_i2:37-939(-)
MNKSFTSVYHSHEEIANNSATIVQWIPSSKNNFLVCYDNGDIYIFDKELEINQFERVPFHDNCFSVWKSHKDQCNPIQRWHLCNANILDLKFSPEGEYLAVSSDDGKLRIFDWTNESEILVLQAYYGNFLCIEWTSDGRYILSGGQDDLVSIFDFNNGDILARGEGHKSWVSSISFDPVKSQISENLYRFATVGEDGYILFWEFNPGECMRARSKRDSMGILHALDYESSEESTSRVSILGLEISKSVPAKGRHRVYYMEHVGNHKYKEIPLSGVVTVPNGYITACWGSVLNYWQESVKE